MKKKIIYILVICMLMLCGCSLSNSRFDGMKQIKTMIIDKCI